MIANFGLRRGTCSRFKGKKLVKEDSEIAALVVEGDSCWSSIHDDALRYQY